MYKKLQRVQGSCTMRAMQAFLDPTGPHLYFPNTKLSEQNLLKKYWQSLGTKPRLLKFSDTAFSQENIEKRIKDCEKLTKLVPENNKTPSFLLFYLNFMEKCYQDMKNILIITGGHIRPLALQTTNAKRMKWLKEQKIAGGLQESEACKQRMIYFAWK